MKLTTYVITFFLMYVLLSCIGDLGSSSYPDNPKILPDTNQGSFILFSQNYSEASSIPGNVFIARSNYYPNSVDNLYTKIYGKEKSEIVFENTTKEIKYTVSRDSPIIPYSLLSYTDLIARNELIQWTEYLVKPVNTVAFCNCASFPILDYIEQPKQEDSLYVCNLTPMVKCTYEITMDIDTDDPQSFVELQSPGSKLIIHRIDNNTKLTSYFQTNPSTIECKSLPIGNSRKSNLKIIFDGENKTNTIISENGSYIITPFYNINRQTLPYTDFSNGYIKFVPYIIGKGTYLGINISSIDQRVDRKFITPIGDSKMIAYGLDGPYPRNLTGQGIEYLNSEGDSGTIWFDVEDISKWNETDLAYLRNLVHNNSWEVGVHFSKELNSLPLDEAYRTMDKEVEYVSGKIGKKPTSWCCLRNNDGIEHAIYAYNKYGMYWRNGDSGIGAEPVVGNLDDDTWNWWERASHAGMTHPVFTHQTDKEPAIKYSISPSKFKTWVDTYYSNNVSIVPFYDYSLISRNTHDAAFDNISSDGTSIQFLATTNGARSLINMNVSAGHNTRVYDNTNDKFLSYELEKDKSITFWVENNHIYKVFLNDTDLMPKLIK